MRAFVLAAVAILVLAPPVRAQEDDATKARAKEAFQQGVADYGAERYEAALSKFQEAQRLKPHPMVQVNIANCYDKLDRPVEAIVAYERFLDAGVAKPEQRVEVTAALKRLRGKVGRLLLNVEPEGAVVVIDGGEERRAPIPDPVQLKSGAHTVDARHDGYQPVTRKFDVAGGAVLEIDIRLEATPAPVAAVVAPPPAATPGPTAAQPVVATASPPAPTREPPPAADDGGGIPTSAWVAAGVTTAFIVAATVTGLLALDAESEFDQQRRIVCSAQDEQDLLCTRNPALTSSQRLNAYNSALDAAKRADALAIATDVLIGAAIVGAGITTYFLLADDDDASALRVTPAFAYGTAGAVVSGRY